MLSAHLPTEPVPDLPPEPEPDEPMPIDEPDQPGEGVPVRDPWARPMGVLPRTALASGLALSMLFLSPYSGGAAELEQAVSDKGVPYLVGGIGEDSRDEILRQGQLYNLKLVFAQRDGAYLADVRVTVVDARGATLLDATASGPFLLAKLPPGTYRVSASLDDRQQSQSVRVSGAGQRRLDFRW